MYKWLYTNINNNLAVKLSVIVKEINDVVFPINSLFVLL